MEKTSKKPGVIRIVLSGAVAAYCGQLLPLLFIAGGLLGSVLLSGGAVPFLFAVAIALVGGYLLGGTGMLLAAVAVASALLIAYLLHKKAAYFETALLCAALITIALYLIIGFVDIQTRAPAFHAATESATQYYTQVFDSMLQAPMGFSVEQIQLVRDGVLGLIAQLPIYMPAFLCAAGALTGLTNVLFCAKLGRDTGVQLKPMHRFLFWRLPADFAWGACVMGAGLLIANLLKVSAMDAVTSAVAVVVLLPFMVQGLSLLWFIAYVRRSGMTALTVLMLLALFLYPAGPPMLAVLLAGMGVAEQLFHIRRRIVTRGNHRDED